MYFGVFYIILAQIWVLCYTYYMALKVIDYPPSHVIIAEKYAPAEEAATLTFFWRHPMSRWPRAYWQWGRSDPIYLPKNWIAV